MKHTFIVRGKMYRAQLKVIDLTGPDVPASIRKDKPNFEVRTLMSVKPKSTSFSKGEQRYFGDNIMSAYHMLVKYVGQVQMPKKFNKYDPAKNWRPSKMNTDMEWLTEKAALEDQYGGP